MRMHYYLALALLLRSPMSLAMPEIVVNIREHLFYPSEITIPADKKVKITFFNHDSTPEELDSFDLNREKVVFGNAKATIYIGPLAPGEYRFFGEFHPASAVGKVLVVSQREYDDVD
ncbi:MAG: plastocyanin [Paraglaciecola sp.]|jgi:plastocyanin